MTPEMQIRVLRRQKTCLEKRVRQLSRDKASVRRGLNVIRHAQRFVDGETDWERIQLKRAIKRFSGATVTPHEFLEAVKKSNLLLGRFIGGCMNFDDLNEARKSKAALDRLLESNTV
jgi:hypothetical protein